MITNNNTVIKIKTANLKGDGILDIQANELIKSVKFTVKEQEKIVKVWDWKVQEKETSLSFTVESPKFWSVTSPNLYAYALEIEYANGKEEVEGRFGFRTIAQNGKNILLNGEPIFVKGYIRGAKAHEHPNLLGEPDEVYYRKNIRQAKSFGFNFIRFHSVVPDETFFKVADEEGILVHIELRMPNEEYNNLEEMLHSKKDLISDEFIEKTVDDLYNHPALAVYCIGNEIRNLSSGNRVIEIGELIKRIDSTRLYLDTCAWGENGRPLIDVDVQHMGYYFPFGKHNKMYDSTDNMLVVGSIESPIETEGLNSTCKKVLHYDVPLFAHEVCHYTALRDFKSLKKKFEEKNQPQPWWIDEELKMINAKGFDDLFDEMFKASKHFQYLSWKTAYEQMRSSSLLGGFHFLQFADTDAYENSNGLVDCFDDATYIQPETFLKINGDTVLTSSINERIFFEKAEVDITVGVSNYNARLNKVGDFSYTLTDDDGKVYASGGLKNVDVICGKPSDICKVRLQLPSVKGSKKFTFTAKLQVGEQSFTNDWELWVYQKAERLSYAQFVNTDEDITITDDIEKAFEGLAQGKKVCLVYRSDFTRHLLHQDMEHPKYAFKATWNRFKPVIWDRGTNYGGLCDKKCLEKYGFATGEYYDFNYSVISEDCDKIILDDFPVKPKVLVRGVDKSVRDRFDAYKVSFNLPELMYDRTMRDFGYLFELNVGQGKLLVCGFNMTGLDKNEPSTLRMADFIKRYMRSADFAPTEKIGVEDLKAYMRECAKSPVKERIMTQFWELDDSPVESKQYWIDSRKYLTE